jgi:hypothetical protein
MNIDLKKGSLLEGDILNSHNNESSLTCTNDVTAGRISNLCASD